jgi:hypothetical protein
MRERLAAVLQPTITIEDAFVLLKVFCDTHGNRSSRCGQSLRFMNPATVLAQTSISLGFTRQT